MNIKSQKEILSNIMKAWDEKYYLDKGTVINRKNSKSHNELEGNNHE